MVLWLKDDLVSRKSVIQRAVIFSAVTLFVLFVFQPFGTTNSTITYKFLRLSGYGFTTFCGLLISGFLEIKLSGFMFSKPLRALMVIALHIGIVAVFNHSYFVVAIMGAWHWQNQLFFIVITIAMGVLPFSFIYFMNRNDNNNSPVHSNTSRLVETEMVTSVNSSAETLAPKQIVITLTGDNKDDTIHVMLSQLLYIKSADNYCELAILEDAKVSHKLLRSSLTRILKQLPDDANVHRCHRSYAVNIALVDLSSGNAGGLQLLMKPLGVTVPVSRSYVDTIKQALLLAPKAC